MVKIYDKISGTFRSDDHLDAFVAVRSYLRTAANTASTSEPHSANSSPPDPGSPPPAGT